MSMYLHTYVHIYISTYLHIDVYICLREARLAYRAPSPRARPCVCTGTRCVHTDTAAPVRACRLAYRAPSPRARPANFAPRYKSVSDVKVLVGLSTLYIYICI